MSIQLPISGQSDISQLLSARRIALYAVLQDYTGQRINIPVYYVRIEYPINQIPVCEIKANVGFNARKMLMSMATLLKQELIQIRIDLYLRVSEPYGYNPGELKKGFYIIFRGYVTSIQYERDVTAMSVTLQATHWLYDLAFSSALSDLFHPSAPKDILFNPFLANAAGTLGPLSAVDYMKTFIRPEEVLTDIGYVLLRILNIIANSDRFFHNYFPPYLRYNDCPDLSSLPANTPLWLIQYLTSFGLSYKFKRLAAEAIRWIEWGNPPLTFWYSRYDQQLMLALNILMMLVDASVEKNPLNLFTLAETTIWERLTKALSPLFLFALIPYPKYGRIVPYMPTFYRWWVTLQPRDIWTITVRGELQKPLMAMGILCHTRSHQNPQTGAYEESIMTQTVGGVYIGLPFGMIKFHYAPHYANFFTAMPAVVALVSLAEQAFKGNNYAYPGFRQPFQYTYKYAYFQMDFLQRLAHFYYTLEVLKEKRCYVVGPLRLDISPGSIVRIESLSEKEEIFGVSNEMLGYVSNVVFIFSTVPGSQMACTAFELSFVRIGSQVYDERLNIPAHPLYSTYFYGSKFISEPEPDQNVRFLRAALEVDMEEAQSQRWLW